MAKNTTAVIERKIRPIYDYLDIGNLKRALQESDKMLKKQPDFHCIKALKTLALIRLNRLTEANVLLDELETLDLDDEYVLQALTYCYRDLAQPDRIITLYEKAIKKQPKNDEFLSHLIMAYCRTGHYKKVSQTAMQLYKLRSNNVLYYHWSIMATLLQGLENETSRSTFFTLAEKMMEKSINENGLKAESEIRLYCLILELNSKFEIAANVLTTIVSQRAWTNVFDLKQKLIELYKKSEKFDEIFQLCKNLINNNPEDWFSWSYFIQYGLKCACSKPEIRDSILQILTTTVDFFTTNSSNNGTSSLSKRAAHLARLKLLESMLEMGILTPAGLGDPYDLIIAYYELMNDKPTCFPDLKPFLPLINKSRHNEFVNAILGHDARSLDYRKLDVPKCLNEISGQICRWRLALDMGILDGLEEADLKNVLNVVMNFYVHGLAYNSDVGCKDLQCGDDYLSKIIIPIIIEYASRYSPLCNEISAILLDTICLLELGLTNSPENYHFKLILTKLYGFLNCASQVQSLADSLSIKYIMHESLWYFIADNFSPSAYFPNIYEWCSFSTSFVAQSLREVSDNIIQCFKAGNFERILEFLEFKQKLNNSLHYKACCLWLRYFKMMLDCFSTNDLIYSKSTTNNGRTSPSIEWSSLADNRDLKLLTSVLPVEHEKLENSLDIFILQMAFLDSVVRLVDAFSDSSHTHFSLNKNPVKHSTLSNGIYTEPTPVNGNPDQTSDFDVLLQTLNANFKNLEKALINNSSTDNWAKYLKSADAHSPFLIVYVTGEYFNFLQSFICLANLIAVNGWDDSKLEPWKVAKHVEACESISKSMLKNQCLDSGNSIRLHIAHLSNLVQTFSVCLIILRTLLASSIESSIPDVAGIKKAKKKPSQADSTTTEKDGVQVQATSMVKHRILAILKSAIDATNNLATNLCGELDLTLTMAALSIADSIFILDNVRKFRHQTMSTIKSSYKKSFDNIIEICQAQSAFIEKMR